MKFVPMETGEIQVIIADNQFLITESLRSFVMNELKFSVKAVVENKAGLIQALDDTSVCMLIIDPDHFDFNGLEELQQTLKAYNHVVVLVLTNTITRNELQELNSIGIKSIALKSLEKDDLEKAIVSTLKGKKYYSQEILDLFTEPPDDKVPVQETVPLTTSEVEIVRLIAEGKTTKEIATSRHISFHTVMTHRKNIFRKLKVNNASELVMFAIRTGIIDTIEYHI
ncbi:MAG TPA: response regulator transcription factor [Bacteroidales bacterium]|nr:response regulator transcription factor [Bacteroidales bacterium]